MTSMTQWQIPGIRPTGIPVDESNPRRSLLVRHTTGVRIARKTVDMAALGPVWAVIQARDGSGTSGTASLAASSPSPACSSAISSPSWTGHPHGYEDHLGEFNLASPPARWLDQRSLLTQSARYATGQNDEWTEARRYMDPPFLAACKTAANLETNGGSVNRKRGSSSRAQSATGLFQKTSACALRAPRTRLYIRT